MSVKKIAIAGAGFSGAVIAHMLAKAGHKITVFEPRNHLGGNCHTARDAETQVMVHTYGPHIFHTNNLDVWEFIQQFSEFKPYINRVKARVKDAIYSLPINLHTLNQFFDKTLSPKEAEVFLKSLARTDIKEPQNFEEQALFLVGTELYEAFFKGYTEKQWGRSPTELPASILKRLPLRFNYDDNYFNHQYQGMPAEGYTPIFERMLNHPNIDLRLSTAFNPEDKTQYDHVFFSGPIDKFYNQKFGPLAYRTLRFEKHTDIGDYQGCAVLNYCDAAAPYTRIAEHKHFTPWENHEKTVYFKEFSSEASGDDIPFYPIGLTQENYVLSQYQALAKKEKNVTFVGRLGTYRYLDMDVTIADALAVARAFLTQS